MSRETAPQHEPKDSPLSLSRLREAFAAMLGGDGAAPKTNGGGTDDTAAASGQASRQAANDGYRQGEAATAARALPACEISPRSVVEALLFVGRPDNSAYSSRELAAAMRGVSPGEVDAAVAELNSAYQADQAPYVIEGTSAGYRLVLRSEFSRMRDKFHGAIREARLSPAAMEVLSIIAYNQPVTAERINALRNAPNGAALSTLVRRRIVRLDRPAEPGGTPTYSTTERFLKLFALESLEELPRSEEIAAG